MVRSEFFSGALAGVVEEFCGLAVFTPVAGAGELFFMKVFFAKKKTAANRIKIIKPIYAFLFIILFYAIVAFFVL